MYNTWEIITASFPTTHGGYWNDFKQYLARGIICVYFQEGSDGHTYCRAYLYDPYGGSDSRRILNSDVSLMAEGAVDIEILISHASLDYIFAKVHNTSNNYYDLIGLNISGTPTVKKRSIFRDSDISSYGNRCYYCQFLSDKRWIWIDNVNANSYQYIDTLNNYSISNTLNYPYTNSSSDHSIWYDSLNAKLHVITRNNSSDYIGNEEHYSFDGTSWTKLNNTPVNLFIYDDDNFVAYDNNATFFYGDLGDFSGLIRYDPLYDEFVATVVPSLPDSSGGYSYFFRTFDDPSYYISVLEPDTNKHYRIQIKATNSILVTNQKNSSGYVEVYVYETVQLTYTVNENAIDEVVSYEYTYPQYSPHKASVSGTGLVTGQSVGTESITLRSRSYPHTTRSVTIQVKKHDVTSVTLNKQTLTLVKNTTEQLTATVAPSNATYPEVTWTSNNTSVATVSSDGTITAIEPGTTKIRASAENKYQECTVTVIYATIQSVSITNKINTILKGSTHSFIATFSPSNANPNINWSSSDTLVATVSSSGVITAVEVGMVTITATSAANSSIKDTCTITVNYVPETGVTISGIENDGKMFLKDTCQLTATVLPANSNPNVIWSTDSDYCLPISNNGLITANNEGYSTITVTTANGITTEISVYTTRRSVDLALSRTLLSLEVGAYHTLYPVFYPNQVINGGIWDAKNLSVIWTSSNPSVATVNADGVVNTIGPGTTIITAKIADYPKYEWLTYNDTATCNITVSNSSDSSTTIPEFITPKTDWKSTDKFNKEDYNRIRTNIDHLQKVLLEIERSYQSVILGDTINYYTTMFKVDDFNALENALDSLNVLSLDIGTKMTFAPNKPFINFAELNRIESACDKLYKLLHNEYEGRLRFVKRLGIRAEDNFFNL